MRGPFALAHLQLAMAGALAAAMLSGCPFAQPVPGVGKEGGGTLTPPRIDTASIVPAGTVLSFQCNRGDKFSLEADILDENLEDTIEARWFVDYDANIPSQSLVAEHKVFTPPPNDPVLTVRRYHITYLFTPDGWMGTSLAPKHHVVELVLSNGFAAERDRAPAAGYETQVYRWLFLDSSGVSCTPSP